MAWHDNVKTGIGWPTLAGALTLAVAFGGFGTWAAVAPLQGAVIAPGKVTAGGGNRPVQHLEGGIVKEILVEEGQSVTLGEPVLVLDNTAAATDVNRLQTQLVTLEAIEARAKAERDGAKEVAYSEDLLAKASTSELATVLEDQTAEFRIREERHKAELGMLEQRLASHEEAIRGNQAELQETRSQVDLVGEERRTFEQLWEKRLTTRSKLLEVRRAEADLRGREGQLVAAIAEAERSIAELREEIQRAKSARVEEASARLSDVRAKRSEVMEQIRAAEDISSRTLVRAPMSGIVMDLAKRNAGAVIAPGEEIMSIVPEGTGVVVEAHVRPQDIDEVQVGQEARLAFAALDPRETPPFTGEVVHISADRLENERTGEPYYLARLSISHAAEIPNPAIMQPGHPVEVFITTGERTLLEYLAEPIIGTIRKSLRE